MQSQLRIQVSVIYRDEVKKSLILCPDIKDRGLRTDVDVKQIVSDMIQYYIDNNVLKIPKGAYELYIHVPNGSTLSQVGETSPIKVLLITAVPLSGFEP